MTLKGQNIHLRALEPEDLDFLYEIENNESIWEVSNTQTPYSKWVLKQYLENAHQDIFEAKQLRLVIVLAATNEKVGLIDTYNKYFHADIEENKEKVINLLTNL